MKSDKITKFNKSRWEAMAKEEIIFSRPWKNLDKENARARLDDLNLLGDVKGKNVLCLQAAAGSHMENRHAHRTLAGAKI